MLFQPIINFIADSFTVLINGITLNGNIELPDNIFQAFLSLFGYLGWFFPVAKLLPLLFFTLGIYGLRATITLIRFIRGWIPTLGG